MQHLENRVRASQLPSGEQDAVLAEMRKHPLSRICDDADLGVARLRASACTTWGPVWQFDIARKASLVTMALGVAILAVIGGLGALAFAWSSPWRPSAASTTW